MENASKALIMAAGVLIALMILGALLLMFSNLSNYQETNTQGTREAQVVEFNNQFETYNRQDIRGTDMVSLMNRVVDYNTRKTGTTSEEQYQKMEISVTGISPSAFKYNTSDDSLIKESYTQDNITTLLNPVKQLENKYQQKYITELSANISNIIDGDSEEEAKKVLNTTNLDKYKEGSNDGITQIKLDTAKYYQYTQFKRTYFDCTGVEYNQQTGRIVKMEFKWENRFN